MKYVKKAGYIVATIFFLVFTLGPFVWTFVMAITPKAEMFSNVVSLLPSHITWSNFQNLFSGGRRSVAYFTGLKNSLRAVIVTICIGMPIALVSAYLPMATWMIINYFSTIPKELEEAAHIDGCSRGKAFFKIILPLSYPIILSVSLIMFLNTWSQFQIPLILASSMDTKPMAIVVSEFVTKDSVEYGLIATAGIVSLIPPVVTAIIFRKYLISGMVGGSVKG